MSAQQRFFSSKVLSGDSALIAESYDLFGNDRQRLACIQAYSQHRRAISASLQAYLSQLFNGSPCEVSMSGINLVTPKTRPAEKSNKLWLKATITNQPDAAFLVMDATTLHAFSVLFLGGVLRDPVKEIDTSALTETEYRLVFQLLKQQTNAFLATQEMSKPTDISCEVITADALPAQGLLLTSSFSVNIHDRTFNWHFWWPVDESVIQPDDQPNTTKVLTNLLTATPVRLRVVLSEQTLPLDMMTNLAVGDVLPLELPDPTPAFIGDSTCFEGRIAEHRGSLVYQITSLKST